MENKIEQQDLVGHEDFPARCPLCGAPKAKDFVGGWLGWECGSASHAHHRFRAALNIVQSIPCAVAPWEKRALRAESRLDRTEDERDRAMEMLTRKQLNNFGLDCRNKRLTKALEEIEEVYTDGSDTYESWKAMGEIARRALTPQTTGYDRS